MVWGFWIPLKTTFSSYAPLTLTTSPTTGLLKPGTTLAGDSDPKSEILRLQNELSEARDDLKSDEEVFKEKAGSQALPKANQTPRGGKGGPRRG